MKKIIKTLLLAIVLVFALACSNSKKENESIVVSTYDSSKNIIEEEVPYNPSRIAIVDFAALDIVDALGLEDKVVATIKNLKIDYLDKYSKKDDILDVGIPQKANLESIAKSNPDLIILGGRAMRYYDEVKKIAPVLLILNDNDKTYLENLEFNMNMIAKVFGKEKEAKKLYEPFAKEFNKQKERFEGKTVVMGLATSGNFNVLGNTSYLSVIPSDFGFVNLSKDVQTTHGNEISFEYLVKENPEYILVLDRDSAIGVNGAKLAKDIMDNDLVKETDAYKNGKIVYLTPAAWYITAGGYTATKIMIKDIENID